MLEPIGFRELLIVQKPTNKTTRTRALLLWLIEIVDQRFRQSDPLSWVPPVKKTAMVNGLGNGQVPFKRRREKI